MTIEHNANLVKEWQALHKSHEQYEHFALVIKLVAIAITMFMIFFEQAILTFLLFLTIFWFQEAIWKTYQARVSDRIEAVEQVLLLLSTNSHELTDTDSISALQYYSQWSNNRAGPSTLIREYFRSAIKPTVIYPYLPLFIAIVIIKVMA